VTVAAVVAAIEPVTKTPCYDRPTLHNTVHNTFTYKRHFNASDL